MRIRKNRRFQGKRYWCFCLTCRGEQHVSLSTRRRHIASDQRALGYAQTPRMRQMIQSALDANEGKHERVDLCAAGETDAVIEDNTSLLRANAAPEFEQDIEAASRVTASSASVAAPSSSSVVQADASAYALNMQRMQRELVQGWLKTFPAEFTTLVIACPKAYINTDLGQFRETKALNLALEKCSKTPPAFFNKDGPAPELESFLKSLSDELEIWRPDARDSGPCYARKPLLSWPAFLRDDKVKDLSSFGSKTNAARLFSLLIVSYLVAGWQNKEMYKLDNGLNSNVSAGDAYVAKALAKLSEGLLRDSH